MDKAGAELAGFFALPVAPEENAVPPCCRGAVASHLCPADASTLLRRTRGRMLVCTYVTKVRRLIGYQVGGNKAGSATQARMVPGQAVVEATSEADPTTPEQSARPH